MTQPGRRLAAAPWAGLARVVAAVAAVAAILAAGPAAARRHGESGGTPGEFDYYLLSLSWSPAFCLESPAADECRGPRPYGFIVHGLWPQGERDSPKYCGVRRRVPDEVVAGVADLMPARGLVYHEWSAHGTCSGLEPADFFRELRRAAAAVAIPPDLAHPDTAVERSTASVLQSFAAANPRMRADALIITCTRQDVPRLREVRVCLDRQLNPRRCSAAAEHGACRAPRLIVPPLR